jgi:hypothetical protein
MFWIFQFHVTDGNEMSFPLSLAMVLRSISLFKCSHRDSSDSKPVCFESTNRVAVYKPTRVDKLQWRPFPARRV